jgi:YHS domain-containing protein
MRRTMWALAAVVVMNGALTACATVSEDQPPAAQQPADSSKAKIGDQITCAIDGMKMALAADTPSAEYQGKTYYFCAESEKQTFLKDPAHYAKH